jgi:hypothetical protein
MRHSPNYENSPRINGRVRTINYARLAEMAEEHSLPFEKLCKHAENGCDSEAAILQRFGTLPPSENWITIDTACAILGIKVSSFYCSISRNGHYSGIAWRSRSRKHAAGGMTAKGNPVGRRGCGVLFKRTDIERLRDIKRAAGISYMAAGKVFHAMQCGKF